MITAAIRFGLRAGRLFVLLLFLGSGPAYSQGAVKWTGDLATFQSDLRRVAEASKIPDQKGLLKRLEGERPDVELLTAGCDGLVDFNAAAGTVQQVVSQGYKGSWVDWEFEVADDTAIAWSGATTIIPKVPATEDDKEKGDAAPRLAFHILRPSDGPFRAGDRVRLKALTDDFSRFRKDYRRALGVVAVYHMEAAPNPVFIVKFDKAELTLMKPGK